MSIDWKVWTSPPAQVQLWEGVALVLNLNPLSLERAPHQFMRVDPVFKSESFPNDTKRAFDEALLHAKRATTVAGPIFLPRGSPSTGNGKARVSLRQVVAFFISVERSDIPRPLLEWLASSAPPSGSELPMAEGLAEPTQSAAILAISASGSPLRHEKATARHSAIILKWFAQHPEVDPMKVVAPLGNKCWPLREQIQAELNLTTTQIKKAFTQLRKDGRMRKP